MVFWLLLSKSPEAQTPTPSEVDCPSASQIEQFTETGDASTDFFDAPTGQFFISYEFPNGAPGIVYRLDVEPERENGELGALGVLTDPNTDLESNQGQTKVEDIPGRYQLSFSPSDPNQEYVVTVYECDPAGGESTIPNPSPSPSPPPSAPPSPSPPPRPTPPPQPASDPPSNQGTLMQAGGSTSGPVPVMPGGGCPREFPVQQDGACYS
jgi:hypothetical protein